MRIVASRKNRRENTSGFSREAKRIAVIASVVVLLITLTVVGQVVRPVEDISSEKMIGTKTELIPVPGVTQNVAVTAPETTVTMTPPLVKYALAIQNNARAVEEYKDLTIDCSKSADTVLQTAWAQAAGATDVKLKLIYLRSDICEEVGKGFINNFPVKSNYAHVVLHELVHYAGSTNEARTDCLTYANYAKMVDQLKLKVDGQESWLSNKVATNASAPPAYRVPANMWGSCEDIPDKPSTPSNSATETFVP